LRIGLVSEEGLTAGSRAVPPRHASSDERGWAGSSRSWTVAPEIRGAPGARGGELGVAVLGRIWPTRELDGPGIRRWAGSRPGPEGTPMGKSSVCSSRPDRPVVVVVPAARRSVGGGPAMEPGRSRRGHGWAGQQTRPVGWPRGVPSVTAAEIVPQVARVEEFGPSFDRRRPWTIGWEIVGAL